MHGHADEDKRVANIHGISSNSVHPASNQTSGIDPAVFAAAMDIIKADGDKPEGLAKHSHDTTRYDEDSIHNHAVEHHLRPKSQGPDGKYQRKQRVAVTKEEIADIDIPGMHDHRPVLR
jgi:hypothetical protein